MAQRKVRWGVLSTANIGMEKVTPAIMKSPSSEVLGIASRDLAKARAAADRLGIAKAYGSYEEMLADPEIDAVYNPLPNDLHVPMTLAAAEAGKHVLCEKPIGLDAADAEKTPGRTGQCHRRRGLHGPLSPAMAPGARDHPLRRTR